MIIWTETTYSSAAYSGTLIDTTEWAYAAADFIKNDINDIEDFAYAHEKRGHFNFLFRSMFKERFLLILQVYIRSMFFCYRLLFSISGWLNKKAKAKKGKQT
jgi:hypothetical protein